jgi:hypothetical protein
MLARIHHVLASACALMTIKTIAARASDAALKALDTLPAATAATAGSRQRRHSSWAGPAARTNTRGAAAGLHALAAAPRARLPAAIGEAAKRTYVSAAVFAAMKALPKYSALFEVAGFQPHGACIAHTPVMLQAWAERAQAARVKAGEAPPAGGADAGAIFDKLRRGGVPAILTHYSAGHGQIDDRGAAETGYAMHHSMIVADVVEHQGRSVGVVIDFDDTVAPAEVVAARTQLKPSETLYDLSTEQLESTGASRAFVRFVDLEKMLQRAQSQYDLIQYIDSHVPTSDMPALPARLGPSESSLASDEPTRQALQQLVADPANEHLIEGWNAPPVKPFQPPPSMWSQVCDWMTGSNDKPDDPSKS